MAWSEEIVAIGDQIAALKPAAATELVDYLKVAYNIEAPEVPKPPDEKPPEKPPEQTEFTVILEGFEAAQKIQLIKTYREITGAALKDAMAAINSCPQTIKEAISKEDAAKLKSLLEECGGKVTVK